MTYNQEKIQQIEANTQMFYIYINFIEYTNSSLDTTLERISKL